MLSVLRVTCWIKSGRRCTSHHLLTSVYVTLCTLSISWTQIFSLLWDLLVPKLWPWFGSCLILVVSWVSWFYFFFLTSLVCLTMIPQSLPDSLCLHPILLALWPIPLSQLLTFACLNMSWTYSHWPLYCQGSQHWVWVYTHRSPKIYPSAISS